jgi:hypothetical protein
MCARNVRLNLTQFREKTIDQKVLAKTTEFLFETTASAFGVIFMEWADLRITEERDIYSLTERGYRRRVDED